MIVISALFWFLLAMVFACVEIEAEDKHGWAHYTPAWHRRRGFIPRIFGFINAGKPLTGYHLFMLFLPLMIFHAPYFMGVEWTAAKELMSVAMYFAWCPLRDYLWFVLNPHFGWRRFNKVNVWCDAKYRWMLRIPLRYFIACGLSVGLAFSAAHMAASRQILIDHITLMAIFVLMTGVTMVCSPLYHRWYSKIRSRKERSARAEACVRYRCPGQHSIEIRSDVPRRFIEPQLPGGSPSR